MRPKLLVVAALVAVALAVPTAAVAVGGEDEVADAVSISPHEGPNGEYATVEDGELRVDFDRLNDEARTLFHDVFTVEATADRPVRVWVEVDTPGNVTAYEGDDPDAVIDGRQDARKLQPGEKLDVGFAVDTYGDNPANGTVTIGVLVPENGTADLRVTEATTSTAETVVGDPVGVEATVVNRGNASGNRTVNLTVDGEVVATETVFVPANATETVRFDHAFDAPGNYSVGVSGTSAGTVRVRRAGQAIVRVTDASVTATEVPVGGRTLVNATVENVGDIAGTGNVSVRVDGEVVATRTVMLGSGERRRLTFPQSFTEAGTYRVSVGGQLAGVVSVIPGGGGGGGGGGSTPSDIAPVVEVMFDGDLGDQVEVSTTTEDVLPADDPSWRTTAVIDPARILGTANDGLEVYGSQLVARPEETVTLTGARSYISSTEGIAAEPRTAAIVDIRPPKEFEDQPATVRIRVSRSAFPETDAAQARVGRRTPNGWQLIPTRVVSTTEDTVLLEARTFGFSTFTVFAVSDVTYEWELPDGTVVPSDELKTSFDEPGRYNVTLTVTDAFGTSDVADQQILVNDAPSVTIEGIENATAGEETTLHANVTNEFGNATVTWTFADGSTATGRTVTRQVEPGETVRVTVEDEYGASSRASATVPVAAGSSGDGRRFAGSEVLPEGVPVPVVVAVVLGSLLGAILLVRLPVTLPVGSLFPTEAIVGVFTGRSPQVTALEDPTWDPEAGWLEIGRLAVESRGSLLDTVEVSVTDGDREVVRATIDVAGEESYTATPERIRVPGNVDVAPDETFELNVRVHDERERMGSRQQAAEDLFPASGA